MGGAKAILKPGDFVQLVGHREDMFFELQAPVWWAHGVAAYVRYVAGRSAPGRFCGCGVRSAVMAEMAVPVMQFKRVHFHSRDGEYDPAVGYVAEEKKHERVE